MNVNYDEYLVTSYQKFIDYDIELEQAVLGICLVEPRAYSRVYSVLIADCFYKEEYRQIFTAMHEVWEYGLPVDLVTVSRRMYDKELVELEGYKTAYYLSLMCRDVVSSAHLLQWCVMLRELAARRKMIHLTTHRFKGEDVLQGADEIQHTLQQALHIRHFEDWQDASVAAVRLMQHIDDIVTQKAIGVSTGFATLDDMNGGFRPGQLIVIGARPSVGKSALMSGMAIGAARQGKRVGILSLEMPVQEIFGRMVSRESAIPFTYIDRHGLQNEVQQQQVSNTINLVAELPIHFSDAAQCTIHDIRAKAEQMKQRHGLDVLMIDYLQLIEETDKYRSREQGIAQISRGLKMLAMNLEIPVIALSQLNRLSEQRADKRPNMADLRESGAIEQDADIVMLLHRDWRSGIYQDMMGNSTEQQADLIICKWRNGRPQDLKLHFEGAIMKFSEAA